jgi:hypothetical protein
MVQPRIVVDRKAILALSRSTFGTDAILAGAGLVQEDVALSI